MANYARGENVFYSSLYPYTDWRIKTKGYLLKSIQLFKWLVLFKISYLARLTHYNNNFLHFKECTIGLHHLWQEVKILTWGSSLLTIFFPSLKVSFPTSFLQACYPPVKLNFLISRLLPLCTSGHLAISCHLSFSSLPCVLYTACFPYHTVSSLCQKPYPIYL